MKSETTIIRVIRLVGTEGLRRLMRLGILVAAVVLTAGCGSGSGDEPGTPSPATPGPGTNPGSTPDPGTTPELPTPSDNETAIVFSAQQEEGQEVTRAGQAAHGGTRAGTPLESSGVTSFKVWGYKNMWNGDLQMVFPGYTVNYVSAANSTTTNTDGWEYVDQQPEQTIKYWDWSVKAYRFFGVTGGLSGAYKPSDANKERYEIGIHISIPDLSIQLPDEADDIDDAIKAIPLYSRLWYSTGIESEYPSRLFGKPVQLEFVRPVSKVRIMFTSSDPNVPLADLELSDPQFMPADGSGIVIKGTFTVSYPLTGGGISESWRVDRDNTNAVVSYLSTIIGRDGELWNVVLPAKGQKIYQLTVYVNGDPEPKLCYVPAEFVNWQPGYEYTYIFKVNEEGGVEFGGVYSAYTDWEDYDKEAGHVVYNW